MGRHLEGSVRRRGNKWLASVPNGTRRMECSFASEDEALAWIAVQLMRVAQGLVPERPTRTPIKTPPSTTTVVNDTPAAQPVLSLEAVGREWHHERYEEMEGAQSDRSFETLKDLEMHIFPAFNDLLGRMGLPRVWLTSHLWGVALREDGCHAQEVPSRVQA
jgi:hypothetical protein